jgi:sulfoxide reductase heme-binding subunit YedZ
VSLIAVTTSATPHLFWITSRAAGIVALILASLAVSVGLCMSSRLLRRHRADLLALHEILALSTIAAIVVHGASLLGDRYLHPSIADIAIPFVSTYKSVWTSLGIVTGWSLALLGLSYYARRWIGAARWRVAHRLTAIVWIGGIVHSLGEGTDAGQVWFLAMLAIVVIPALGLLARRRCNPPGRTRDLQAGRVAHHEPSELAPTARPPGPGLGQRDRVKPPPRHLHPDVIGIGVDGDPASRARVAPVLELARDHRGAD